MRCFQEGLGSATIETVRVSSRRLVRELGRVTAGASLAVLTMGAPVGTEAQTATEDKRGYHLFRPVPRESMRELSTDRPDLTESPYTVDAGHFQIEADAVSFSREDDSRSRHESLAGAVNLKAGLSPHMDLQLVVPLYERTSIGGLPIGRHSEWNFVGNSTARLKINLWGNDGGTSALAVMPFVGLPTGTHGSTGGVGVCVPLGLELPGGFGSGFMLQFEHDDGSTVRSATATVGHSLMGPLSGYVEAVSASLGEDTSRSFITSFSTGLTYSVNGDVQLDGGLVVPTTSQESGDFTTFLGLAVRR